MDSLSRIELFKKIKHIKINPYEIDIPQYQKLLKIEKYILTNMEFLKKMHRTHYSTDINQRLTDSEVTLLGWVKEVRDLGGIVFVILRDGRGTIQIAASKKKTDPKIYKVIQSLAGEYVIAVTGSVKSPSKVSNKVEIHPNNVEIIAQATHPLPLDTAEKVPADIDTRLDARILDLRRNESYAIFRIRHEVLIAIRDYLTSQGFLEVQTPKIIAAAAEGGAALFKINYFNEIAYLAQSPELYKEQLTTTFDRVYEIGSYFRAEESHSRRHLNEFTSVDIEAAFADYEGVMKLHEELVYTIIEHVLKKCDKELDILKIPLKPPPLPLKRYSYNDILKELAKNNFQVEWGEDIHTQAYRKLGELHKNEFYFITDWPISARPFYIKPGRDKLSYSFDLMYEWIEISSGGSRVDEKEVLVDQLKKQNLKPEAFKFFLSSYDYGMPPHAGWGMGLERLLMAMLKRKNIREVILFPRDRFRLTP